MYTVSSYNDLSKFITKYGTNKKKMHYSPALIMFLTMFFMIFFSFKMFLCFRRNKYILVCTNSFTRWDRTYKSREINISIKTIFVLTQQAFGFPFVFCVYCNNGIVFWIINCQYLQGNKMCLKPVHKYIWLLYAVKVNHACAFKLYDWVLVLYFELEISLSKDDNIQYAC